jgi:hypothetical protein
MLPSFTIQFGFKFSSIHSSLEYGYFPCYSFSTLCMLFSNYGVQNAVEYNHPISRLGYNIKKV